MPATPTWCARSWHGREEYYCQPAHGETRGPAIALRLPPWCLGVEVQCAWLMELDAITAELPAEPEIARNPQIELTTHGEQRRRWTIEQKQTIAAQSLAPGASPTEVARQYGISSGQLYTWRHALLAAQPEAVMHTAGRFAASR